MFICCSGRAERSRTNTLTHFPAVVSLPLVHRTADGLKSHQPRLHTLHFHPLPLWVKHWGQNGNCLAQQHSNKSLWDRQRQNTYFMVPQNTAGMINISHSWAQTDVGQRRDTKSVFRDSTSLIYSKTETSNLLCLNGNVKKTY